MSQRISVALAATVAIGLGGVLAAPGAMPPAAAETLTGPVMDTTAGPVDNISAQARREGDGKRGGERRPGGRPKADRPGGQRPGAGRPDGTRPGAQRPGDRRPGAGPGPRPPRAAAARRGPRYDVRIRGGGPIVIGGRRVTVIRDRHRYRWRGRYWNVVPITALTALTIGAIAYRPYAYVPVGEPVCTGYTEDGCFLRWVEVPTAEGELVPQCVTYCEAQ